MRNNMKGFIKSIILVLVLAFTSIVAKAGVSLSSFIINNNVTPNGQFYATGQTSISATFDFIRSGEAGPVKVQLVLINGTTTTVLSSNDPYKGTWGNEITWSGTITGNLPADKLQGSIALRIITYYLDGSISNEYNSGTQYLITTSYTPPANNDPGPGPAPVSNPPVAGAIPIYMYSQYDGGVYMTTSWLGYSRQYVYYGPPTSWLNNIPEQRIRTSAYAGIIGYTMPSVNGNLVEGLTTLYRYNDEDNGDNYYIPVNSTYPSYQTKEPIFGVYITPGPNRIPVYSYLVWNEYHSYSTDVNFTQDGYHREGIAFYILGNTNLTPSLEGTVNWYGYFHPGVGNHYNTTANGNYPGYIYEGVVGRVFSSQHAGTVALYQYYNPSVVDHCYYTANTNIPGYQNQGISCYVYTSQQPGTIPIYGYFNPSSGDHYYTRGTQTPSGYVAEGIQFYVGA